MAGEVHDNNWPLPKFYFSVQFGDGTDVKFQEVSGLESEAEGIEYRHGNGPVFSPIKMPDLGRVGNVTLRKGIFARNSKFWEWYNEIKMNTIKRRSVVINLLNESGVPRMVWTLNNAWPTKITSPELRSDGNEVAVESIELAYETLTIAAS
jgi:phage tail-like protein